MGLVTVIVLALSVQQDLVVPAVRFSLGQKARGRKGMTERSFPLRVPKRFREWIEGSSLIEDEDVRAEDPELAAVADLLISGKRVVDVPEWACGPLVDRAELMAMFDDQYDRSAAESVIDQLHTAGWRDQQKG